MQVYSHLLRLRFEPRISIAVSQRLLNIECYSSSQPEHPSTMRSRDIKSCWSGSFAWYGGHGANPRPLFWVNCSIPPLLTQLILDLFVLAFQSTGIVYHAAASVEKWSGCWCGGGHNVTQGYPRSIGSMLYIFWSLIWVNVIWSFLCLKDEKISNREVCAGVSNVEVIFNRTDEVVFLTPTQHHLLIC